MRRIDRRKAAISVALRRQEAVGKAELALLALLTLGLIFGVSSFALAGATTAPTQVAPQGEDPPDADEDEGQTAPPSADGNLSQKLDKQDGVIKPPATGDSGIYGQAPDPDPGTTPVIPAPGSPGGNQNVEPK